MTTIYAAILILGAPASASREMTVEGQTIAGVVFQMGKGAFNDLSIGSDESGPAGQARRLSTSISGMHLTIDGTRRSGFSGWWDAGRRVGGYVLDTQHAGSVEIAYRLRARGYTVDTTSIYRDGFVSKSFSTGWTERVVIPLPKFLQRLLKKKAIIREVPIHVTIEIRATETNGTTRIVGIGRGTADTSDFACGLVRRIAEQRAAAELRNGLAAVLLRIQTEGTRLYFAGDPGEVAKIIQQEVRIGSS